MYFVRTASEGDLPKVRDLLVETWHATYDRFYGVEKVTELTNAWHSLPALKARLQKPGSEFLVADSGTDIGGMGFAAMSGTLPKTAFLHQLYVRPSCQRQGIGRDILAEIETCFPDVDTMRLEVEPGNETAIAFYRAHGFAETGRTNDCGGGRSGIVALIMEKSLRLAWH